MSESTAPASFCPQCGGALPLTATAGLCPRCLMAEAMAPTQGEAGPAPQPPLPPEQIAPHFPQLEILECLGRGGMGVVYKARQKSLGRLVALKLLAPERVGDTKFAERFAQEAQALAALSHPNIVTIHDFGQVGGFYYLLMEFVDGVNLRQLLRARKFTPEEALAIVPALCDALQFAHERGIVHRDIKPENLLLDKAGRVKIADFGIAKMLGTPDTSGSAGPTCEPDNATGGTLGTPGYSAPEQKTDPRRADSRADIYSLGVVFYEMLTGELPGNRIEPPSKKVQMDVRLDAVVLRALEKTPELRWQTAQELRTQVETLSTAAIAQGVATSTSTATIVKGASTVMNWTKSKTRVLTAATVILAVCFVLFEIVPVLRRALAPDIQGTWEGVVHLEEAGVKNGQAAQAHFILRLFKKHGVYQATTDWPEWGKTNIPLVSVVYDYPNLVIQETVRDTWNFKVSPRAAQIFWDRHIHFIQPDPVVLTRTATPTPVPEPLTESDFAPGGGSALQGYWEGEIGTGTDAVPVDLKIAGQPDGTWRAEGDSPTLGVQGRPMIVSYDPPVVEFRPADGAGKFSGQFNESRTKISGSWTQGGQSLPANVRRVDYQAEHAHDADKDYSFGSNNDLPGHWLGAWIATYNNGKIKVPIREALDIAKLPGGSYSATLANVDGFGVEAPVPTSDFEYSPPSLHVECKWQDWGFDGKLENGKLAGIWNQGGGGFPLVFEREK